MTYNKVLIISFISKYFLKVFAFHRNFTIITTYKIVFRHKKGHLTVNFDFIKKYYKMDRKTSKVDLHLFIINMEMPKKIYMYYDSF